MVFFSISSYLCECVRNCRSGTESCANCILICFDFIDVNTEKLFSKKSVEGNGRKFYFFFIDVSLNSLNNRNHSDLSSKIIIIIFFLELRVWLFFFFNFIYLFLAVLGLRFCARVFSSCGKWGPLFIAVRGPLTIAASLVAEHRLQTRRLSNCGSRA